MTQTTAITKRFFFVTVLRALAACLITNAHYSGVYPAEFIASGGLLGDVIFFGVSGFCLSNIKKSFVPWYGKRLWRCYLPTVIITAVYLLIGFYSLREHNLFWWMVFPTAYHFVASIVILYIPYYIVMSVRALRDRLPVLMLLVGAAAVVVYIFFYDKSTYHIDKVREPFIEFLFFESMLIGAYFAQKKERFLNRRGVVWYIVPILLFGLYLGGKTVFSRYASLSYLQIFNQVFLLLFLFSVFRCFIGLDALLERMPKKLKSAVSYIAEITLEIYVVQYALIPRLAEVFPFPLNWLAITASILVSATILHFLCKAINIGADRLIEKMKQSKERSSP